MSPTSAPKDNSPGTRIARATDGTGVVVIPGQAVLVNDCLWNRRPWCLGEADCCLIGPDDLDCGPDPF